VVGLLDATVVLGHGALLDTGLGKGRDSSDRRRRRESGVLALALLVLLALPATAQDDDVLDWLGGESPAEALPPTQVAPPAQPARDALAPDAAARRAGRVSPAAQAYGEALREAMLLELQVQDVEVEAMDPGEDPSTLKGFRKQRWERIQKDRTGFRQLAGQMSLQGLETPRPAEGVAPSRDIVSLLVSLDRAYESSRVVRTVEQYMDLNREFLAKGDWSPRERAVLLRDELIAREVDFTRLMQDAATLLAGTGDEELLARCRDGLAQLAPEAQVLGDDLAVLVLNDAELREQVMAEVTALLTTVKPPEPPPAPESELRPKVAELQVELVGLAGLEQVIKDLQGAERQLDLIDGQLEQDMPLERRKDHVGRRTTLVAARDGLQFQWYSTEPEPATFDALVQGQDGLIARRMLDLGPSGVLYGARVQALRDVHDEGLPDSASRWRFLEQQQDVLTLLDSLQPTENPLLGLEMPDINGLLLLKEAQAKVAAEKAAAAKSAPKPSAKKKGAGGKKPALGKPSLAPKPKKAPPKKGPSKQGGHGGKQPY